MLDCHHSPCAWHLDVQYAALAPDGATETIGDESLELRWYAYTDVAAVAAESVVRLTQRVRELLGRRPHR